MSVTKKIKAPRKRIGYGFFIGIVSIILAAGAVIGAFSLYQGTYTVEVTTEQYIHPYTDIGVLQSMINDEAEFLLIDVRELDEYADEHIMDSVHIPVGNLWDAYENKIIPRNIPVILYSNNATRSTIATKILTEEPFALTNVSTFSEGLNVWKMQNMPVVGTLHAEYIDPLEVSRLMKLNESITFIDTRSNEEFNTMHIADATNIPYQELLSDSIETSSDTIIVLVDTVYNDGYGRLIQLGYDNVYVLEGGMERWEELEYATESSEEE